MTPNPKKPTKRALRAAHAVWAAEADRKMRADRDASDAQRATENFTWSAPTAKHTDAGSRFLEALADSPYAQDVAPYVKVTASRVSLSVPPSASGRARYGVHEGFAGSEHPQAGKPRNAFDAWADLTGGLDGPRGNPAGRREHNPAPAHFTPSQRAGYDRASLSMYLRARGGQDDPMFIYITDGRLPSKPEDRQHLRQQALKALKASDRDVQDAGRVLLAALEEHAQGGRRMNPRPDYSKPYYILRFVGPGLNVIKEWEVASLQDLKEKLTSELPREDYRRGKVGVEMLRAHPGDASKGVVWHAVNLPWDVEKTVWAYLEERSNPKQGRSSVSVKAVGVMGSPSAAQIHYVRAVAEAAGVPFGRLTANTEAFRELRRLHKSGGSVNDGVVLVQQLGVGTSHRGHNPTSRLRRNSSMTTFTETKEGMTIYATWHKHGGYKAGLDAGEYGKWTTSAADKAGAIRAGRQALRDALKAKRAGVQWWTPTRRWKLEVPMPPYHNPSTAKGPGAWKRQQDGTYYRPGYFIMREREPKGSGRLAGGKLSLQRRLVWVLYRAIGQKWVEKSRHNTLRAARRAAGSP